MAFTLLAPILVTVGLVVALAIVIRRMPQVASLAGKDLAKAEVALKEREENPSRMRRSLRVGGQIAGVAWAKVKKGSRFIVEKVFRKLALSGAITKFATKLFAKLYRTRKQEAEKKAPVVKAESVKQIETPKVLQEKKKEHEEAMEISRLEKKARHELLMNNTAAAEKLYIAMVKRDSKSIEAYRGLAEIYEKQANWQDMKASLEQILEIDKHDTEAKRQLEKLVAETEPA